jgi:predicted Zn-dependent protease
MKEGKEISMSPGWFKKWIKGCMVQKKFFLLLISVFVLFAHGGYANASFTIEDEKKLGKEFYEKLEKSGALSDNVRVNAYVSRLGNHIVSVIPESPFEYRFSVVNSSAINAFATPGGYVYVNRGLINLVENESELAGVLSHEIGHVYARHIADIMEKSQKVNIATLAAILAGAFLGGGGDLTAAVASFSMATATTLNLKYSREHEEEADRLGISFLTKAGYNGKAMPDFLKIMSQNEYYSSNVPSYFLTHPGTDERIRYLDALLQTRYSSSGSQSLFGQLKRVQVLLALEGKDPDTNLKYFQAALLKNPQDVDCLYGMAATQQKLGLISQSLDNFYRALKLAPDDDDILRDMGIAYFNNGQPAEAVNYLRKAVEYDKNNLDALSYLGKSYEAVGNYTSAIEMYKNVENKKPGEADVHYNLAVAYGRMNNLGESHYHFGIYFKKKKKLESALFHFREALKYFPPDGPRAQDINNEMKPPKGPRAKDANNEINTPKKPQDHRRSD